MLPGLLIAAYGLATAVCEFDIKGVPGIFYRIEMAGNRQEPVKKLYRINYSPFLKTK
jgi:hypothetical protein